MRRYSEGATALFLLLLCLTSNRSVNAQSVLDSTPNLSALVDFDRSQSDFKVVIHRYEQDRAALYRRYDVSLSPVRRERLQRFYADWQAQMTALDFGKLNHEGQIDYVLLRNRITFELQMLRQEEQSVAEMAKLVPFARTLEELQESRRDREGIDGREAATVLNQTASEVESLTANLKSNPAARIPIKAVDAERAARHVDYLSRMLEGWNRYFSGYDPLFTWWVPQPYERLQVALESYSKQIRTTYAGDAANGPVMGDPIGEEGLRAHLANEMIPYSAEELIAIAEAEFAWMETALVKASEEMGYGSDWKAAQEAVKNLAVDPGQKPAVVLEIEKQSIDFINEHDWITLPPMASEIWRMEMMSPERQRVAPFFLGGETIQISYPTNDMTHDEKLMSMRGNNPHFNRATVHHELIPGHHLQGFMSNRFNEHRGLFGTPFWTEGWALYWEMVLWDAGFPRGPEDEIGMLFWRMHRAARIIFSLSFHLGKMTPSEAVDFLVDRVGHERANAEAEVRRSFAGDYSPLYQVAYMMGGIQFRALNKELVDGGKMTAREFHDAVLKGGPMPVEMVRAQLANLPLTRDYESKWRFME